MELQPGDTFLNRYEIVRVMGAGGHGIVYEGLDPTIGRRVAIKVLLPDHREEYSPQLRERFRREAAAVANLRDPHTVTLLDYGESSDGLLFLVFEFVDGRPLHQVLQAQGALAAEPAVDLLRQVLQSLREAHAAGILHRDVKPDNIIVYSYMGDPFRAKLVDFGLAMRPDANDKRLTQEGIVLGTARYVSPEGYVGDNQSPASDIFSLGLVFFEVLTGCWANNAEGTLNIANEQVSAREFYIPEHIPESVRAILARMIRKKPEERFQSAQEVLHALDVIAPRKIDFGGGGRELSADDFASAPGVSLELDDPIAKPVAPQRPEARPMGPSAAEKKRGGGVLGFALVLTLLLTAASGAAIMYLDIELPWNKKEPVRAADLEPRTFPLDDPDTMVFYVDFDRGIVATPRPDRVGAEGRCAMLFDSRQAQAPPGIFYFADAVDWPQAAVTARPISRDELVERAALCADAGTAAWEVEQSAEIMAAEIRIAQLEKQRDNRVRNKKIEAQARQREVRAERSSSQKEKLIKMLLQKGTGLPLDLLTK